MDNISFKEIFDLDELQNLMNALSKAFGIGVGIRDPKGRRLIPDSHCSDFCGNIIRKCALGKKQCEDSYACLSAYNEISPMIWRCRSAGLIDACVYIVVSGVHIASILLGQVRLQENEMTEEEYRDIARSLELDEELYLEGLKGVPIMSMEKFESILSAFSIIANQLSRLGYHNLEQSIKIKELESAESALQAGSARFRIMAEKDALTGLFSRAKFEQVLDEYEFEKTMQICLVSGDANNLKLANDIFGHEAGDNMLKGIAEVLCKYAREDWLVARCGGDEFRILMPNTRLAEAKKYCEKVVKTCKASKKLEFGLSVALGFAEWNPESESLQECFNRADQEMYEEKKAMKQKENMLDYLLERCYEKHLLYREAVKKAADMAYDFAIHLGFNEESAENVRLATMYQDVGLIEIPEQIVLRGAAATAKDKLFKREHVVNSHAIALHFPKMRQAADIILCTHEHWDGYGYPRRVTGQKIPLESRIASMVSNYAYWITSKPQGDQMNCEEAFEMLRKEAGKKYDPDLVEWFISYLTFQT